MRYSILVYVTGSFLRLSAFERTSNPIPLSMYIVQGNCEGIVGIIPVVGYFLIYHILRLSRDPLLPLFLRHKASQLPA